MPGETLRKHDFAQGLGMSAQRPLARLRHATDADLGAIRDIYNHYVLHSTSTAQCEPETIEERRVWFEAHGASHPVLVAVTGPDEDLVGWGALSRFHPRAGYDRTVEDSVYLHPDWRGRGLGTQILRALCERARELQHHNIIALISDDQAASVGLHHRLGFEKVGHLKNVVVKFDRSLGVVFMQKRVSNI